MVVRSAASRSVFSTHEISDFIFWVHIAPYALYEALEVFVVKASMLWKVFFIVAERYEEVCFVHLRFVGTSYAPVSCTIHPAPDAVTAGNGYGVFVHRGEGDLS